MRNATKRFFVWVAVVALVVGGGIAVFWPIDHWRLYDANLQPLALTEQEAYCTGFVGINAGFKEHDPDVKQCHDGEGEDMGTEPSIANTPGWTCRGILDGGWPGSEDDCIGILEGYDLWPLLEGGLAMDWNEAHPRPQEPKAAIEGPSRAIERNIENRSEE